MAMDGYPPGWSFPDCSAWPWAAAKSAPASRRMSSAPYRPCWTLNASSLTSRAWLEQPGLDDVGSYSYGGFSLFKGKPVAGIWLQLSKSLNGYVRYPHVSASIVDQPGACLCLTTRVVGPTNRTIWFFWYLVFLSFDHVCCLFVVVSELAKLEAIPPQNFWGLGYLGFSERRRLDIAEMYARVSTNIDAHTPVNRGPGDLGLIDDPVSALLFTTIHVFV